MFKLFLLLSPLYATLFWAVVLNIVERQGNEPKWFLGKFMIVSLIIFISHTLYYLPLPELYIYADSLYYLAHLLTFPLYYIYVRLLAIDPRFSLRQHYKFLILPVVIFLLYGIGTLFMSKADYIGFLYPTLSEPPVTGIFLYQKIMRHLVNVVFVTQGMAYMSLSIIAVRRNSEKVANFYSNSEYSLRKVQWLNVTLLVTIFTCIVMEIISKENFAGNSSFLIAPSVILTGMLFWIGLLGNSQRQVLLTCGKDDEMDEEPPAKGITAQQHSLQMKIETLFTDKQVYLNENLTVWDLVQEIGTNRTYISRVINNDIGVNFSQFVNGHRLAHARRLTAEQPGLSKEEVALQSGFGSAKSMRRAEKRE